MPNVDHVKTNITSLTQKVVGSKPLTNKLAACKWILVENDAITIRCSRNNRAHTAFLLPDGKYTRPI